MDKVHAELEAEVGTAQYHYLTTALLGILIGFATTATIFTFQALTTSTYLCNQNHSLEFGKAGGISINRDRTAQGS